MQYSSWICLLCFPEKVYWWLVSLENSMLTNIILLNANYCKTNKTDAPKQMLCFYKQTNLLRNLLGWSLNYILRVTLAYSDTFSLSQGCHCKQADLFWTFRTAWGAIKSHSNYMYLSMIGLLHLTHSNSRVPDPEWWHLSYQVGLAWQRLGAKVMAHMLACLLHLYVYCQGSHKP